MYQLRHQVTIFFDESRILDLVLQILVAATGRDKSIRAKYCRVAGFQPRLAIGSSSV